MRDICRLREDAAKEVAAQPTTAGLLQNLLEEVMQSDRESEGSRDVSSVHNDFDAEEQSNEGGDSNTDLMLCPLNDGLGEDGASGACLLSCYASQHSSVGSISFSSCYKLAARFLAVLDC